MRAHPFTRPFTHPVFSRWSVLLALAGGAAVALPAAAQSTATARPLAPATPVAGAAPDAVYDRGTQRTEILHSEDNAARIDEVRHGGEMRSMTVESKKGFGRYEVAPAKAGAQEPGGMAGRSTWRVFQW